MDDRWTVWVSFSNFPLLQKDWLTLLGPHCLWGTKGMKFTGVVYVDSDTLNPNLVFATSYFLFMSFQTYTNGNLFYIKTEKTNFLDSVSSRDYLILFTPLQSNFLKSHLRFVSVNSSFPAYSGCRLTPASAVSPKTFFSKRNYFP